MEDSQWYIILSSIFILFILFVSMGMSSGHFHIGRLKNGSRHITSTELSKFTTTASTGEIVMIGSSGVMIDQGSQGINVSTTDIMFYAGLTPNIERMRIMSSTGYVGIGTFSPSQMLSVNGTASVLGNIGIGTTVLTGVSTIMLNNPSVSFGFGANGYEPNSVLIGNVGTGSYSGALTVSYNQTINAGYLGMGAPIQGFRDLAYGALSHQFYTTATSNVGTAVGSVGVGPLPRASLTIASTGRIGIANPSPSTELDVNGTISVYSGIKLTNSSLTNSNNIQFIPSNAKTVYGIQGVDSTSTSSDYFRMGRYNYNDLVISPVGKVGVGTTNPSLMFHVVGNNSAGTMVLQNSSTGPVWNIGPDTNQNFVIYNSSYSGVWLNNATPTGWIVNSDSRLKNTIEPLKGCLNQVMKMNPVSFYWNQQENQEKTHGLIAQELQEIVPELVSTKTTNGVDTLGIRYTELIPTLIGAIQELKREIQELRNGKF